MHANAQAGGSIMADEVPARMEDLTKIRRSKTTKTVLKSSARIIQEFGSRHFCHLTS